MDERGHTRWERNPQGIVTYYGVHPTSGRRTLTIRDVDTANPPPQIKKTDKKSAAWQGAVPFGRNLKRAKQLSVEPEETIITKAANQIIEAEYDKQGDTTITTDSNGNVNYTIQGVNRTIRFPAWDNQLLRSVLPISVTETDDSGKILETYELPPTAVVVENGKPVGIQEGITKNTWTRYTYDEHTGKVKYVDRYHTIPATGTGTLGVNFYRTVTIYDLRGREVAVTQYISDGRWMVDAKKLDWRGREIATLRGEAMNPPAFADLNNPSFLHTLTKTVYDGNRIDRTLAYFGSGADDYIGTKYHYDRFNRLRATSSYSVQGGTETTFGPYHIRDYDWNSNNIAEAVFDKEPNWNDVTENENYVISTKQGRHRFTKNYYLANGRSYRRETFGTDSTKPVTKTDSFYDESGRQVAVQEYNALRTETVYDSVGRVLETRTLDGKNLVAKTRQDYDELGRVIGQHHFTYPTNAKNIKKTRNDFVCQTVYFWYDNAGRIVTQANYGCGTDILSNAPIPVRPKTTPQKPAKEYLVTHTIYDPITGKQIGTTDQREITNRIVHNALGQTLSSISNYVPIVIPMTKI
jgi:hypothetical protein